MGCHWHVVPMRQPPLARAPLRVGTVKWGAQPERAPRRLDREADQSPQHTHAGANMTASYIPPGMPPLPPPAPTANAYIKPSGPLQQSQPPPPPETSPSPQDDPHRALLTTWHAHHADAWTRADELHPAVRRLIDARERLPAIRQKIRQLAGWRPRPSAIAPGDVALPAGREWVGRLGASAALASSRLAGQRSGHDC